jgi:hypothetical protein
VAKKNRDLAIKQRRKKDLGRDMLRKKDMHSLTEKGPRSPGDHDTRSPQERESDPKRPLGQPLGISALIELHQPFFESRN